jgi:hypothetical protein
MQGEFQYNRKDKTMPRRSGSATDDYDEEIRCDCCDNREFIGGEITEKTLEGDGWYLGFNEVLCPDHSEME